MVLLNIRCSTLIRNQRGAHNLKKSPYVGTRAPGVVHMRGVKERLCNEVCSNDKQTFVIVDFHGRIANGQTSQSWRVGSDSGTLAGAARPWLRRR